MSATPMPPITRYTGVMDWLTTVDHKKIGMMYFWFVVISALIGGAMAGLIRVQLAMPGATVEAMEAAVRSGGTSPACSPTATACSAIAIATTRW